jgi:ADP-ribose pyrophosphatase
VVTDPEGAHEILSSEPVFEGRVIKVFVDDVRLPDGRTVRWERVAHPGAVGMVPLLPDGRVLMVRQYRNAVGGELLEIPAGKLDRDETPEACAMRELVEEVGHTAGELVKLAEFYNSPGYADEYFYLFLALDLSPREGQPEPDEFLRVERCGLDQLLKMVSKGLVTDAKSIVGITLATLYTEGRVPPMRGGDG